MRRFAAVLFLVTVSLVALASCAGGSYGEDDFHGGSGVGQSYYDSKKDALADTEFVPDTDAHGDVVVYFTNSGKVYHARRDCPSLARSEAVESGTVEDAAGKERACSVCGGGK